MLYKEAMDPNRNNVILKELGVEEVFGKVCRSFYRLPSPVVLYSLEQEKIAEGLFVNVVRTKLFYGMECGMLALDSAYMAKVRYRNDEYFVIDDISPFEVGLNEDAVAEYRVSDLRYAGLDELEFISALNM